MAQSFVVMGSQLLAPLRAVLGANGVRYSIPVVGIGSESSVAQRQPDTSTLRGRLVNLRQQCAASLGGLYDPVVLSHCSPATATTRAVFTATSGSRRPMFNINNLWTWCARSCLHLPDSSPASSGRQRGTPRRPRLASRVTDKAPGEKDCPGLLLGQTGLSGQGRVMVGGLEKGQADSPRHNLYASDIEVIRRPSRLQPPWWLDPRHCLKALLFRHPQY
jgi:hypothetical protein